MSTSGKVNYKLFRNEISNLNEYLAKMSDISLNNSMGANEKLAFWINVYNASTLKLILDSYPVKSIKDINNGSPWDLKWIKLNNRTYSLNEIENDIIRKQFKEPRIHFALNCAAKSCPPLFNIAFDNDNISSLLESQTKSFINSTENNVSKTKIVISRIFEWYSVDFGNVVNFINKYHTKKANLNASISYKSYDWALNE